MHNCFRGARHGLKALGKLTRIEQQEKILLNQEKYNGYSHKSIQNLKMEFDKIDSKEKNDKLHDELPVILKKKKKKKKNSLSEICPEINSVEEDLKIKTSNYGEKKKDKRKNDTNSSIESNICEEVIVPKKKKMALVVESSKIGNESNKEIQNDSNIFLVKKNKKRKKL